jgi:epoxyqueuosine reductase
MEQLNKQWLDVRARELGADRVGVAKANSIRSHFLFSGNESKGLDFGVSIAVTLSKSVLTGIESEPTLIYKWNYRQANALLDRIAFCLARDIEAKGFRALPVPASQIVDWKEQRGHLSHRAVAEAAGLGRRGKNNLLVDTEFGSRLRLVTVLTDMPLQTGLPQSASCGDCRLCVEACPAGALGDSPQEYRLDLCLKKLDGFSKMPGIGQHICGVCVRACPWQERN